MKTKIVIPYNNLPRIAARLPEAVDAIVRKAAFDIEAHAKSVAPVDTGCLKNSIFTVTSRGSNYAQNISEARSANPKAEFFGDIGGMPLCKAIVSAGAKYAIFVEYKTRSFMRYAAEKVRSSFISAMSKLERVLQ